MDRKERAHAVIRILNQCYPRADCALDHKNTLELLVATILSAQCTDKRVNIVTKALFQRHRTAKDYAESPPGELEEYIKSTGFYRNKAKNIRAACRIIHEKHGGEVPDTMEELLLLPGVARKTANVVLGVAFGKAEGVVVDTHVMRITNLLGLTRHKNPKKIEDDLIKAVPQKDWIVFSHLLILLGREICIARRPKCMICPLNKVCPYGIRQVRKIRETLAKRHMA